MQSNHHDRARALNAQCSAPLKPSLFAALSCAKSHVAVSMVTTSLFCRHFHDSRFWNRFAG